jgi:hypothetical protein
MVGGISFLVLQKRTKQPLFSNVFQIILHTILGSKLTHVFLSQGPLDHAEINLNILLPTHSVKFYGYLYLTIYIYYVLSYLCNIYVYLPG